MWIWMTLASAFMVGAYDLAKKKALEKNGIYYILVGATALTTLFLCPFLTKGPLEHHLMLIGKAALVTVSWVSGMVAVKLLPITTVSSFKASRPMFVVLFSILIFGERPNFYQWMGVAAVFLALWLLGRSSEKEGIKIKDNGKGFLAIFTTIIAGVASALYDKVIIGRMEPLFMQSWGNVYITAMLALIILVKAALNKKFEPFRWDWTIVVIGVFVTLADMLYFFALKQPGAMLSIISLIRRSSVIITFAGGALIFKEHNIKGKAIALSVMLIGIALLMFGSL